MTFEKLSPTADLPAELLILSGYVDVMCLACNVV